MSAQTDVLRKNLHAQLDRLLDQLADLDQIKGEMDVNEYNEARQDTVDQLEDFGKSLEKMKSGEGGPSLLDDVQRIQNVYLFKNKISIKNLLSVVVFLYKQAIKCAISQAFQTPEVIRFFAKKQPVQLRNRLAEVNVFTFFLLLNGLENIHFQIERDTKVGKLNGAEGARQKKEILDALKKLGETLTGEEEIYLKQYTEGGNANFAKMSDSSGKNSLYHLNILISFVFSLDVNVNALSAVAAKQIENARAPR